MKDVILSSDAPSGGPYSQATVLNNTIYVSGQLPIDVKTGKMVEGIENQTKQSLNNITAILKTANSSFEKVAQVIVLLNDMSDFSKMNAVYTEYLGKVCSNFPARICYAVKTLPQNALVEIACIAGC